MYKNKIFDFIPICLFEVITFMTFIAVGVKNNFEMYETLKTFLGESGTHRYLLSNGFTKHVCLRVILKQTNLKSRFKIKPAGQ